MPLHEIAADLEDHVWYAQLVEQVVAGVEAFAARWAAFEELVAAPGDVAAEADEPPV